MELTDRKLKILQAIIGNYVMTAEPVGSRTLAKQFNNAISSATIRNEMSDLEDMGYLTHPHTSAGRVPSDKAYRLYVNNMMGRKEIPKREQEMVHARLRADAREFDDIVQRAAELLSEMTNLASFALSPTQKEEKLKFVNLMPVDEHSVILMIVADSGRSQNTLLHLKTEYTEDMLRILSKNLTYDYRGKLLTDVLRSNVIQDFQNDLSAMGRLEENIMPNFMQTLEELLNVNLYTGGLSNIFDIPEFADLSKAKNFVSILEQKDKLTKDLMEREDGMVVTIGSENPGDELKDCSLITATYHVNGKFVGKIGVIGPTRMRYDEITSVVQYMTENLENSFRIGDGQENGSLEDGSDENEPKEDKDG